MKNNMVEGANVEHFVVETDNRLFRQEHKHLKPPGRDFTRSGSDQVIIGHCMRENVPAALRDFNRDSLAQFAAALLKATQKFAGIFNRSQS